MRLFVGAWPPPEVRAELAAAVRRVGGDVRWSDADRLHVTLRFLGEVDDPDEVTAVLRRTVAGSGTAEATTGERTMILGGAAVVPVTGIGGLSDRLADATGHLGRAPEDRPFVGHVTLARPPRRGRIPADLIGVPVPPTRWTVHEVLVVASVDGTYRTLATIPLG